MTRFAVRKSGKSGPAKVAPVTLAVPVQKRPPKGPSTKVAAATAPGGGSGDKFEAAIRELSDKVDGRLPIEANEVKKTALKSAKIGLEFALWTVNQGNLTPKHAAELRNAGFKEYAAAKKKFEESDDPPPPPKVIEPSLPSEVFVG